MKYEVKYNSVISLLTSIDHKNMDGSDITADQIRKKFLNRLNNLDDSELLEAIILEDTANCD